MHGQQNTKNEGIMSEFSYRDWRNPLKPSVNLANDPTEIKTMHGI